MQDKRVTACSQRYDANGKRPFVWGLRPVTGMRLVSCQFSALFGLERGTVANAQMLAHPQQAAAIMMLFYFSKKVY